MVRILSRGCGMVNGERIKRSPRLLRASKRQDIYMTFSDIHKEIKRASNVHERELNEPSSRRIEDEMYVVNKSPYS